MTDDKLDDLRRRVEYEGDFDTWTPHTKELIRDLWAWGQQQAAQAKAWKHANAFEPVTGEQADFVICYPGTPLHWHMQREDLQAIVLYRQRKL